MLDTILKELVAAVAGAKAAIFLDGDGEAIVQAGDPKIDVKLVGAWKEIHLDHIRDITQRLNLGSVRAVLFSLDEGNELIVPVSSEYCLVLFLSALTAVQEAMPQVNSAVERLKKEIE